MTTNPHLDIDRIIDDRRIRIVVCCGSGGVGKTTTAAGLHSTDALASELADELAGHARHIELADRERTDIEAAGQPVYELTLIPEGIDLAALHRLAAELRDQGAA